MPESSSAGKSRLFLDGNNIVGLRLDEFSVDGDRNIIAYEKTAGLKRGIPHKSLVFAIDFRYCRGTDVLNSSYDFSKRAGFFDTGSRSVDEDRRLDGAPRRSPN